MAMQVPFALLLPAAIVLAGLVAALLVDAFERRSLALWLLVASLSVGSITAVVLGHGGSVVESPVFMSSGGSVLVGGLGYLLTAVAIVAGHRRLASRARGVPMAALMALGALFAAALAATLDLLVFVVSLSGMAVVAYALVAGAGTRRAEESAVRYLIQGMIASALTIMGVAYLLGVGSGLTGYGTVLSGAEVGEGRVVLMALGLVTAALAFKVGAFPFHSWVPDAYETADPPVAAYLGAVPKMAGVVALTVITRVSLFEAADPEATAAVLTVLAVGSLVFGAFGMVRQRSVGRMLGYSAIAQVGYALAALAAGSGGVDAAVVHIAMYALAACAAFVGLEAVLSVRPEWDGSLEGLKGLSRQAPVLAASLAVVMLSLTGVPLLAGFWGKYAVLIAAVEADLVWLAVLAGVAAVVSFGGYGSVVRSLYFDEAPETPVERRSGGLSAWVVGVLAIALIVLGILPLLSGLDPFFAALGL